jgi:hypothetical protein
MPCPLQVHPTIHAPLGGKGAKSEAMEPEEEEEVEEADESQPQLVERSLYLFTLDNPIRKAAIATVANVWFDRTVLSLILANCVFLAM